MHVLSWPMIYFSHGATDVQLYVSLLPKKVPRNTTVQHGPCWLLLISALHNRILVVSSPLGYIGRIDFGSVQTNVPRGCLLNGIKLVQLQRNKKLSSWIDLGSVQPLLH